MPLNAKIQVLADKGYQGILNLQANSQTSKKKPKKAPLSKADQRYNRNLARRRVIAEHVKCRLKIWRILAERYRNRRRRFGLRFNLIAGLYNYELRLRSIP
jgi:IS5 family transposase